jgi:hypothetical protein
VGAPDFFGGTTVGLSLHPVKAQSILSLSLCQNLSVKDFHLFLFFLSQNTASFLLVEKYLQKPF